MPMDDADDTTLPSPHYDLEVALPVSSKGLFCLFFVFQSFVVNQFPWFTKNAYLHWTGLKYGGNNQWKWANGARFYSGLL